MKNVLLLALLLPFSAFAQLQYPVSKTVNQVDNYFGTSVSDPYRWLEDASSSDTKEWVAAQNKLTSSYLDSIPFRAEIKSKLLAAFDYTRLSAPVERNGYYYYYSRSPRQNQSVFYRRKISDSITEVVLDPNALSGEHTITLRNFSISRNGRYGAYLLSKDGSDWQDLYVMDMQTLKATDVHIKWIKLPEVFWQGNGFYYEQLPTPEPGKELTAAANNPTLRHYDMDSAKDEIIYADSSSVAQSYYVGISEDQKYLLFTKRQWSSTSAAMYIKGPGDKQLRTFIKNIHNYYEYLCTDDDAFIFRNNQSLVSCDIATGKTKVLIPACPLILENAVAAGGKLFLTYQDHVSDKVFVYNMNGRVENEILLPPNGTVEGFEGPSNAKEVFYSYSSFVHPPTIYKYDINHKTSLVYFQSDTSFDTRSYELKQVFYHRTGSSDISVPMYILYRKGMKKSGAQPTILTAYGGYSFTSKSRFDPSLIPFLDAGGIYAVAGIRGGGEYGWTWHLEGSGPNKTNGLEDVIAAAEYLIRKKYTNAAHLALLGRSHGGMVVAACINMRPDLFRVAIPIVPFIDLYRFDKFTVGAYSIDELSSPNNEKGFNYLNKYSPLHNIKPGTPYPATLAITADHDDRVVPSHSYKYIATLQKIAGPNTSSPLLLRINRGSGHINISVSSQIDQETDIYSFIFSNIGLKP